jgi:hypothetical protein
MYKGGTDVIITIPITCSRWIGGGLREVKLFTMKNVAVKYSKTCFTRILRELYRFF